MEDSLLNDVFGPPSPPPDSPASPSCSPVALRDCSECDSIRGQGEREWTRVEQVEGLWLCRRFLTAREQAIVLNAIEREKWFDPPVKNQAIRFGSLPPIAVRLTQLVRAAALDRATVAAPAAAGATPVPNAAVSNHAISIATATAGATPIPNAAVSNHAISVATATAADRTISAGAVAAGDRAATVHNSANACCCNGDATRGDGAAAVRGTEGGCGVMSAERNGGWGNGEQSRREPSEREGGGGDGEGSGRGLSEDGSEGRGEGGSEDGEEQGRSGKGCQKRRKKGKHEGVLGDAGEREQERGLQEATGFDELIKAESEQLRAVEAEADAEQLQVQPLSRRVLQREPLFDQMIANWYSAHEGIKPHVDLMRFDDGIAILSLLSPCVMTLAPAPTTTTTVTAIATTTTMPPPSSPLESPVEPPSPNAATPFDATVTSLSARNSIRAKRGGNTSVCDSSSQSHLSPPPGFSISLLLAPGDLLLLSGRARYDWTHGILRDAAHQQWEGKQVPGLERISITLRKLLPQ